MDGFSQLEMSDHQPRGHQRSGSLRLGAVAAAAFLLSAVAATGGLRDGWAPVANHGDQPRQHSVKTLASPELTGEDVPRSLQRKARFHSKFNSARRLGFPHCSLLIERGAGYPMNLVHDLDKDKNHKWNQRVFCSLVGNSRDVLSAKNVACLAWCLVESKNTPDCMCTEARPSGRVLSDECGSFKTNYYHEGERWDAMMHVFSLEMMVGRQVEHLRNSGEGEFGNVVVLAVSYNTTDKMWGFTVTQAGDPAPVVAIEIQRHMTMLSALQRLNPKAYTRDEYWGDMSQSLAKQKCLSRTGDDDTCRQTACAAKRAELGEIRAEVLPRAAIVTHKFEVLAAVISAFMASSKTQGRVQTKTLETILDKIARTPPSHTTQRPRFGGLVRHLQGLSVKWQKDFVDLLERELPRLGLSNKIPDVMTQVDHNKLPASLQR